jgi:hypothetical protein
LAPQAGAFWVLGGELSRSRASVLDESGYLTHRTEREKFDDPWEANASAVLAAISLLW